MDTNNFISLVNDVNIALNFVIAVFILQIGAMFFLQWYRLRKKELDNKITLSYGIYFSLLAISMGIYFYIINFNLSLYDFDLLFIISALLRGVAGIILSIMIDITLKRVWSIKYIISMIFISLFVSFSILAILRLLFDYSLIFRTIEIFNLIFSILPIIFTYYFMKKSLKSIKRKLIVAIIGLILLPIGLSFSSIRIETLFGSYDLYTIALSISRFVIMLGLILIIVGFSEYSFITESEWKENIVSIYIFDQKTNRILFERNFMKYQIKREDVLSLGISGVVKTLENFDRSGKDIDILNMGNNYILFERGGRIFTSMILKKLFLNAQYLLREITSKFEYYFWSYLEAYDFSDTSVNVDEFFRPMNSVINRLLNYKGE